MSMFWDLSQDRRISSVSTDASRASQKASEVAEQQRSMEARVDSMMLACQAMWEIIRDQHGISDQQLQEKMEEIDLRDGRLDGRISPGVFSCAKCGRNTSRRRDRCLYCGQAVEGQELFGKK